MSDEMFSRLLDLVSQAGDGGFTLAIIYLLEPYFVTIAILGVIAWIASLVYKASVTLSDEAIVIDAVIDAMGSTDSRPYYKQTLVAAAQWAKDQKDIP